MLLPMPDGSIGLWRSLVAHYTGGVGVAGSNPVSPTAEQVADLHFSEVGQQHASSARPRLSQIVTRRRWLSPHACATSLVAGVHGGRSKLRAAASGASGWA